MTCADLPVLRLTQLIEREQHSAGAAASGRLVDLARRLEDEKQLSRSIVMAIQQARAGRRGSCLRVRR